MNRAPYPLVVIGLDGASFNVLKPLMAAGELPNLQRLYSEGMRTDLHSTVPPATLPAWTSFLSAASPAVHGVTDLFVHQPGTYRLSPAGGRLRRVPTILSMLSQRGFRVASLGVPGTYPPEEINGICLAGFDYPGGESVGEDGVWPASYFATVQSLGGWHYGAFNEHAGRRLSPGDKARALVDDIATKERVILHTFDREPWDLFVCHLQASDTAAHHLWHTFDPQSPRADQSQRQEHLPNVYRRLDELIGRLVSRCSPQTRVMVVSDHGFGGAADRAMYLNRWLHQRGYLRFGSGVRRFITHAASRGAKEILGHLPRTLVKRVTGWASGAGAIDWMGVARGHAVDFGRSVAFSDELDYAPSIWLNHQGVFPSGCVERKVATGLRQRLRTELLAVVDPVTGAPLIDDVVVNETNPDAGGLVPDLTLVPAWPGGYRTSFLVSGGPGATVRRLSPDEFAAPKGCGMPGVHRREGVFIAHGPAIPVMDLPVLDIPQAGALVFALMGLPLPRDLDAQLPSFLDAVVPLEFSSAVYPTIQHEPRDLWPDQTIVTERLRGMGYLD